MKGRRLRLYGLGLIALVVVVLRPLAVFYTELLWYASEGRLAVFATVWKAALRVGLLAGVLFFAAVYLNLRLARGENWVTWANVIQMVPRSDRVLRRLALLAGLVAGVLAGTAFATQWPAVESFLAQVPFGLTDPVFGRDVGWYVFALPFYRLVHSALNAATWLGALVAAAAYIAGGAIGLTQSGVKVSHRARRHLLLLLGLLLTWKAWGYYLARFGLLLSPRGITFGAGYTDVHVSLPAYSVLTALALVAAFSALIAAWRRSYTLAGGAVVLLLIGSFMGGWLAPGVVQRLIVTPNEIARETPYIVHNIALTNFGFGLGRITERPFAVEDGLTSADLARNQGTLNNVRIWDWRALRQTYSQLQEIRPYYHFHDVDIDRYVIDGTYRQVMIAARELNQAKLPADAHNWVNLRLKFTHGYGAVMSPSNAVATDGRPLFFLRDIPPRSASGLTVQRPELYFGEVASQYVIVKTAEQEFDYPAGDANVYSTYQGSGGFAVGGFLRKLVIAFRLGTYEMLFATEIRPESVVLMHRNITDRAKKVAPFLVYDEDPYIVVNEGRLWWIQDAYTVSSGLPYSQPTRAGHNYIRNSVKVVTDAYNGTQEFYMFDEADPVIQTYSRIFPGLFKPQAEFPAGLLAHVRYPVDLFNQQIEKYNVYHMRDPVVFFNKEDVWAVPRENFGGSAVPVEPYYAIMRLPDGDREEFVLMQPLTPRGKDNMIAWVAARSDAPHYGTLVAYLFPKQELVLGPMQVEARIDQNPEISAQLTLWGTGGSSALRGNLLVIPIERSLLYVEPLYLQASGNNLPELKRVIAAYGDRVVMEETLEKAIAAALGMDGRRPGPVTPGQPQPGDSPELIATARALWVEAQSALRRGDWAAYGRAQEELGRILEQLAGSR